MEKQIKVFNQFNPPIGKANPVGDGKVPVFDYVTDDKTGDVIYKEVGKTNLYELIQSAKDGTDIHYIAERMSKGDNSLANARKGYFVDTSSLPKDVFELEEMSKTIRATYNSDGILQGLYPTYEEYEKAFMNGQVFNAYLEAANKEKKVEVKENEVESK